MFTWQPITHIAERCVHQHEDGSWWFMDENGAREYGGYILEENCRAAFNGYVDELNREEPDQEDPDACRVCGYAARCPICDFSR